MPNVYCEVCNFKFSIKANKPKPKKCPYCDRVGSIRDVKTAQDMLDEVEEIEERPEF